MTLTMLVFPKLICFVNANYNTSRVSNRRTRRLVLEVSRCMLCASAEYIGQALTPYCQPVLAVKFSQLFDLVSTLIILYQ